MFFWENTANVDEYPQAGNTAFRYSGKITDGREFDENSSGEDSLNSGVLCVGKGGER